MNYCRIRFLILHTMEQNYKKSLPFRAWFYFRQGWATYFAFIFAAVNTMVVTYYLAIEKLPYLKEIFPNFVIYLTVLTSIGIPLLIFIGYVHYKRSSAISEEVEITYESNPYIYKIPPGWNKEVVFPLYSLTLDILMKISKNEKLSGEELNQIDEMKNKISQLMEGKYIGDFWKVTRSKKKP